MSEDHSAYHEQVREVVEEYREARAAFEPPPDPPAPERAMAYCREGLGPTVMVYVDARTNDRGVRFSEEEFELLHEALNGYLELYAACHGVEMEADFTLRDAAELLVDTHNVRDVAAMLTTVRPDGDTSAD